MLFARNEIVYNRSMLAFDKRANEHNLPLQTLPMLFDDYM